MITRDQLKAWMKTHNKSTIDVASLTGINPRTVERFLIGHTNPHPPYMKMFADLIKTKPRAN